MPTKTSSTDSPPAAAPRKRPGRPPTGSRAMTQAEIQRAYRRRRRDAESVAYGKPAGQSTSVILKALARQLAQLDDQNKADQHDAVRYLAGRALGELCRRYKVKPI